MAFAALYCQFMVILQQIGRASEALATACPHFSIFLEGLSMKKSLSQLLLAATAAFTLTACINIPYKAPTQQGNYIEPERIPLIREGMTKLQLANAVGSPVLQDVFHSNRWDYIYRLDKHYQKVEHRRITVWFNNDVAVKIDRDLPAATATPAK